MNDKEIVERLQTEGILTRSIPMVGSSLDEKSRSMRGVFATENPVRVMDWERGEPVDEMLMMDGMEMPDQMPFLDNHNRSSYKDQLGSACEMRVNGGQMEGRVIFGNTPDGEAAYSLAKDKHIRDLSIGYSTPQSIYVEPGQSYTHKDGRTFTGPLKIALRTIVKEVSLTPIGADAATKLRKPTAPDKTEAAIDYKRKYEDALETIKVLTVTI
jgi:hypothetical protein